MKRRIEESYSALCSAMASGKPVPAPLPPEVDNLFYERLGISAEDILLMLSMDETMF